MSSVGVEAWVFFQAWGFIGVKRKFSGKSFPGCEQFASIHRGYTRLQGDFYGTVQEETSMLINMWDQNCLFLPVNLKKGSWDFSLGRSGTCSSDQIWKTKQNKTFKYTCLMQFWKGEGGGIVFFKWLIARVGSFSQCQMPGGRFFLLFKNRCSEGGVPEQCGLRMCFCLRLLSGDQTEQPAPLEKSII